MTAEMGYPIECACEARQARVHRQDEQPGRVEERQELHKPGVEARREIFADADRHHVEDEQRGDEQKKAASRAIHIRPAQRDMASDAEHQIDSQPKRPVVGPGR